MVVETAGGLSTLSVSDVDVTDSGRYTISVTNELGCDTCDSSVTVEGELLIMISLC